MDVSKLEINFFIKTMVLNDYSGKEIYDLLVHAHGEIISLRRTQEISKEYREGRRLSTSRLPGSGRPVTSSTDANVENVKSLIEKNNGLSCHEVELLTGIPSRSVNRILTVTLKKKCLLARWIPHQLTDLQKKQRVQCGQSLLYNLERRLKHRLLVVDEKWIYHDDNPPITEQRYWLDGSGDRPKVARKTLTKNKTLWIMATNFEGAAYYQLLQQGETVTANRYIQFLKELFVFFENKHPFLRRENLYLMHDNARPHIAAVVDEFIRNQGVTCLKQPPYSPDYNLMDRYIFRNYEVFRRNNSFNSREEVTSCIDAYIATFTKQNFSNQYEHLKTHLQKVIQTNGDYL